MVATRGSASAPAGALASPSGGAVEGLAALAVAFAWTVLATRAARPAEGEATADFFSATSTYGLPAAATVAYLSFCWLGPRLMASRPAFSCKSAMLVYNAYQAAFNAVCVFLFVRDMRRNGLAVWGNVLAKPWNDEPRYGLIAACIWLHYNNKYVELLDSVFMVLRKKSDQLSFLHCYHHCMLIWAWLLVVKTGGCVDAYFGACCNSVIHVLMYSYYLLAALGFRCSWKRYLTLAQMVQFVACAAQSCVVLLTPGCCPASLPLTQLWVMTNMFVLFGRFYLKSYTNKTQGKHKKAA